MSNFLKCKMCGGDLQIIPGLNIAECEYCGTRQSVPRTPDERKTSYFNRANEARRANEFNKAIGIYESIVSEYPDEAEAYWGLCLCTYGIEYVDDKKTGKKIPTCHRTVFNSFFEDKNFASALLYADNEQKQIYQQEASEIDRIQKSIINTVKQEKPFDVFICYKETNERTGQRTKESVIGQNLYDDLCSRGIKTFFARVSLEDVLGQEYEPHIFAALSSARVMLALGSSRDNFYAPWVQNEWSRYLEYLINDKNRVLIPCFIDMNAHDLPMEFSSLQAQDLGKVGATQDIIRGIEKILSKSSSTDNSASIPVTESKSEALFERGKIALHNKEWSKAQGFFDEVLNNNPRNAAAYMYLLLIEKRCVSLEELSKKSGPIDKSVNYKNAVNFADEELLSILTKLADFIQKKHRSHIFKLKMCIIKMGVAIVAVGIIAALIIIVPRFVIPYFANLSSYREASVLLEEGKYDEAVQVWKSLGDFKDSKQQIENAEAQKLEVENKEKEEKYQEALTLFNQKDYQTAKGIFISISDYKDSREKIWECQDADKESRYQQAVEEYDSENYFDAMKGFSNVLLKGYKDSDDKYSICTYMYASQLGSQGEYERAINLLKKIPHYENSIDLLREYSYYVAISQIEKGNYDSAKRYLAAGRYFADGEIKLKEIHYMYGCKYMEEEKYDQAVKEFVSCQDYKDGKNKLDMCKNIITGSAE